MRKLAGTLLAVVIAVAGVIGLIAFFNSRDDSTTNKTPTTAASAANGPSDGNVVLSFSDPAFEPKLRELADSLGATDTPALRQAGQAVIVRRDPQAGGVVARAAGRRIVVAKPDDPQLQDFIDRWLGQGAAG
ncbi:MAG: hypothetical protein ACJ762_11025 [Solirubrobacteraceae bacterium]